MLLTMVRGTPRHAWRTRAARLLAWGPALAALALGASCSGGRLPAGLDFMSFLGARVATPQPTIAPTPVPTPTPTPLPGPYPRAPLPLPTAAFAAMEGVAVGTVAGDGTQAMRDGPGDRARFAGPQGLALGGAGKLLVADAAMAPVDLPGIYGAVRVVAPDGAVTTLAGDGSEGALDGEPAAARFRFPYGVAADGDGALFVADVTNHAVRKVFPAGFVYTPPLKGPGGGAADRFDLPHDVALDAAGNMYVADTRNRQIRRVTPAGEVSVFAGTGYVGNADGPAAGAGFDTPIAVAVGPDGAVYVADEGSHRIRRIRDATVITLAGLEKGFADGATASARFNAPAGLACDSAGNLYVADAGNHRIRRVTPAGIVTTLAGAPDADGKGGFVGAFADGTGSAARFHTPVDVAFDAAGLLYVSDYGNHRLRRLSPRAATPAP
ncbi:MAG: hypothetical protein FJZ01_26020 [Candidatus Sericytochromatia bacterium]|nr:hypothetical protein [Candidatus Tanganyikabacteria bacterium]